MLILLRDADGDGVAEFRDTFAAERNRPFGLAFRDRAEGDAEAAGYLYVGDNAAVVRYAYRDGQTRATGEAETIIELPASNQAVDRDTAAPGTNVLWTKVGGALPQARAHEP